ncbi:ferrous iron transport protein B [Candidatus Uabimicrobium amorphum]|uniref:Ferrous iron transport protein B n=1 Tax=Uabimicrobium amorphum TaxID=2596890 RepID=A0A5S9IKY9_UABAM|nr:ferrous iron transport protein B [Candidatus Uabimicrobium amorphum]BBM83427.1 ferrous iron transporter B [Candidatus Uabimicrobium amorphum]
MTNNSKRVALIGNPNVGKTTLFNSLTGLRQKIGNFPGVTVEKKIGTFSLSDSSQIELIDLPGIYSLTASSEDQWITVNTLLGHQQDIGKIDAVIAIVDASNLERNLYLVSQVLELQIPTVVALNMQDVATKKGISVDGDKLSEALKCPVVEITAKGGVGVDKLKTTVQENFAQQAAHLTVDLGNEVEGSVEELCSYLNNNDKVEHNVHRCEALTILLGSNSVYFQRFSESLGDDFREKCTALREKIGGEEQRLTIEAETRYKTIEGIISSCSTQKETKATMSSKMDHILIHPIMGTIVFLLLMMVVFQAIYSWSGPLMDFIDEGFAYIGEIAASYIPEGTLQSLVVDGMIAGVGAFVIFLPQIVILFAFIAILEDCGYMARAAFLMDRIMKAAGLSGNSFIPMLSSFACAIPGVMATRVIKNPRDRLATILVLPLMSCSARLPVYTILIAAFIPATTYFGGWIGLQGLVLFAMYMVGLVVAFFVAFFLKKSILKGSQNEFVMEMPSYKIPHFPTVFMRMYNSGRAFVVTAGTFIFFVTIVVWAVAYFPRSAEIEAKYAQQAEKIEQQYNAESEKIWGEFSEQKEQILSSWQKWQDTEDKEQRQKIREELVSITPASFSMAERQQTVQENLESALMSNEEQQAGEHLRHSILGRVGVWIEPVVKPLGWNWKIGVATIASFPAREVIVATLGIIYNLGAEEDEESNRLRTSMREDRWPDGSLVFTPLVAISVMVFFALCCQCGATLGVIWRETNSIKWPVFTFTYMTVLAYVAALIIYQFGTLLGW